MTTIFAPITPLSKSGVLVIRISGPQTVECLKTLGVKKILQTQTIFFQKIFDPKNHELIDETLISFFKAPKSFTGEDVAEISIHGSSFIAKKIFTILSEIKNVRFAEAGEFSKRAFLNNKLDLVQSEAIPDLIAAETEAQHKQALKQLQGGLGKIYEEWRQKIIEISAQIEAFIDFPDEDLPDDLIKQVENKVKILSAEIKNHLNDQKVGQKIKNGLKLAIIGAPNVGKSSLINFLAQSDVAIVSEIAGTTRDVIDVHLSIAGVPVIISDTAGIRDTEDKIEKEGIKRALQKADEADIKIFLIDTETNKINHEHQKLIDEKTIVVINKIDLLRDGEKASLKNAFEGNCLMVSITNKINVLELFTKLEEKISNIIPTNNSPLITQERYRIALVNSLENLENFSLQKNIELAAEDLRMSAREIGKITGKVDVENILDVIFSSFCIGK